MEKVFITKYALTKGILEKEAEIRDYGYEYEIAYVKGEFSSYSLGKEAFRTREQAMERAEKMRLKKIASLKKTDRSIGKDEIQIDMNEKEYLQQELNEWYNIQSTLLNFLSRCSDETTAFVRGALEELAESLETE